MGVRAWIDLNVIDYAFGKGRLFIHNPLDSALNKAKDPHINRLTLLRLSYSKDAAVREAVAANRNATVDMIARIVNDIRTTEIAGEISVSIDREALERAVFGGKRSGGGDYGTQSDRYHAGLDYVADEERKAGVTPIYAFDIPKVLQILRRHSLTKCLKVLNELKTMRTIPETNQWTSVTCSPSKHPDVDALYKALVG